jgi:hypothetical protein
VNAGRKVENLVVFGDFSFNDLFCSIGTNSDLSNDGLRSEGAFPAGTFERGNLLTPYFIPV